MAIKPQEWLFTNLGFTTDACLVTGGATCRTRCLTFSFPDFVLSFASHILALELFAVVVSVKFWSPSIATSASSHLL